MKNRFLITLVGSAAFGCAAFFLDMRTSEGIPLTLQESAIGAAFVLAFSFFLSTVTMSTVRKYFPSDDEPIELLLRFKRRGLFALFYCFMLMPYFWLFHVIAASITDDYSVPYISAPLCMVAILGLLGVLPHKGAAIHNKAMQSDHPTDGR